MDVNDNKRKTKNCTIGDHEMLCRNWVSGYTSRIEGTVQPYSIDLTDDDWGDMEYVQWVHDRCYAEWDNGVRYAIQEWKDAQELTEQRLREAVQEHRREMQGKALAALEAKMEVSNGN